MSELKYDPELPIWVSYSLGDRPVARFRNLVDAHSYRDMFMYAGVVIDTTPKPKIPEDAEFITWMMNGANAVAIYVEFNPLKPWEWGGIYYSQEELLKEIGDDEVTVLVRKDEK